MSWRAYLYQFIHGRPPSHLISGCSPIIGGDAGRVKWWCVTFADGYTFRGTWRRIPNLTVERVDARKVDPWTA